MVDYDLLNSAQPISIKFAVVNQTDKMKLDCETTVTYKDKKVSFSNVKCTADTTNLIPVTTTTTKAPEKKSEFFKLDKCDYSLKKNSQGEVCGMDIKVWGTYTEVDELEVRVSVFGNIYYDEAGYVCDETCYEHYYNLLSESSDVNIYAGDDSEDSVWNEGTCSYTFKDNYAVISLSFYEPVENGWIDFCVDEGLLLNNSNGAINRAYDVYEIYF